MTAHTFEQFRIINEYNDVGWLLLVSIEKVVKTICMDIQKASISQSNLEKEGWKWKNQSA